MCEYAFRIGVVGYSKPEFDHEQAGTLLAQSVSKLMAQVGRAVGIEIVSGLTNAGMPRIAYEYAVAHGITTVGISAARALHVSSGVFEVDMQIIEGLEFGDESDCFVEYIDALVRIGGGPQSHHETGLFIEKCRRNGWPIDDRLIAHELPYRDRQRASD